jgi:predicted porin
MQGKLLAAALVAALPLMASAQSNVTVYGIADAAIGRQDTGAPNGSSTVITSGTQSTSRIGFRGTEELGGGMKAVFNVEAGIALDTGMGDSALFGRRAVVGLESQFGQLLIGREYTPIADVANATDINGQGFYGSNLSSFGTGRLTRRISNSVSYRSNPMAGFKLGLAYGAGETTTGPSLDLMGISLAYAAGKLYVGAGYHTYERLATGDDKEAMVGVAYKMGAVEVRANYMAADPTGANNKYEQANAGVSFAFGPSKLYANLQRSEMESGARGNLISLAYTYALSKRTNAYASYATLRNNASGVFGITSAGATIFPPATALGADPSGFALGVRHSF